MKQLNNFRYWWKLQLKYENFQYSKYGLSQVQGNTQPKIIDGKNKGYQLSCIVKTKSMRYDEILINLFYFQKLSFNSIYQPYLDHYSSLNPPPLRTQQCNSVDKLKFSPSLFKNLHQFYANTFQASEYKVGKNDIWNAFHKRNGQKQTKLIGCRLFACKVYRKKLKRIRNNKPFEIMKLFQDLFLLPFFVVKEIRMTNQKAKLLKIY
ncbi:unnamed protein product [Paramecium pentaurelia]|uniref:Uncharacterized protein n=1 Tax=Paramecium pentaurelia TaxID=43138 RepID=A0A8S1V4A8_9CILI|nr:unnamed protein product [Paramecium pentaurelia]